MAARHGAGLPCSLSRSDVQLLLPQRWGCVDCRGLSSNQLTGSLPGGWGGGGSLPELQQLFLSYNQLSGTVPSSLRNLESLQDL